MASVLKAGLQQTAPPRSAAPTLGYAAIAAGAIIQPASTSLTATTPSVQTPVSTVAPHPPLLPPMTPSITTQLVTVPQHSFQDQQTTITTSPSLTQLSVTSPMLSSAASGSQMHDGSFYSGQDSPAVSEARAVVPRSPSVVRGPWLSVPSQHTLHLYCRF